MSLTSKKEQQGQFPILFSNTFLFFLFFVVLLSRFTKFVNYVNKCEEWPSSFHILIMLTLVDEMCCCCCSCNQIDWNMKVQSKSYIKTTWYFWTVGVSYKGLFIYSPSPSQQMYLVGEPIFLLSYYYYIYLFVKGNYFAVALVTFFSE